MLNSFGNITNFYNSQSWIPILPPVLPKLLGLQEVGGTWQLPPGVWRDGSYWQFSWNRWDKRTSIGGTEDRCRSSLCQRGGAQDEFLLNCRTNIMILKSHQLCSISLWCTPTSTAASCGGGVGPGGPVEAWLWSRRRSQAGLVGLCVDVQRLLLLLHVVPVVKDGIPERKQWEGRSFWKSIKAIWRIQTVSGALLRNNNRAQMKVITIWSANFSVNWTFQLFTFINWSEKQLEYLYFFYQQLPLVYCTARPALSSFKQRPNDFLSSLGDWKPSA